MMPIAELSRKVFAILIRELCVVDTVRFFRQMGLGTGDFTKERRELFEGLTLDEYRRAVQEMKAGTPEGKDAP
jgi:hypothetical protein